MGTIALVLEAGRAIALPCSATVVVPALLLVVATRGRPGPTLAVTAGAVVGTFTTVAWAPSPPEVLHGLAMVAGWAAVAGTLSPRMPATLGRAAGATGGLVVGVASGLLWRPCVGARLGDALTAAVVSPWPQLPALALYTSVLSLPAIAIAAAIAVRSPADAAPVRVARVVATALGLLVAVTVTVGAGDELTAALYRWSR